MRLQGRLLAVTAAAAALALAGLGNGGPSSPSVRLGPIEPIAAAMHHAAVIVDTGSEVKRVCVAFPEEELTGAELLRRAAVDAVFSGYSGKGQAVCSLCGIGCPAGDCFCDRTRYWAYHRAAPGAGGYTYSRAGASSTVVKDGDVEGWRWGSGSPPPFATVGEVCQVPDPPARASSAPSATTSTTTGSTTSAPAGSAAPPATATPARDQVSRPALSLPPSVGAGGGTPGVTLAGEPVAAVPGSTTTTAAGPSVLASGSARTDPDRGSGSLVAPVVFAGLLIAIVVWRSRLRRANVRRATTVR